jgi:hypothetical protein
MSNPGAETDVEFTKDAMRLSMKLTLGPSIPANGTA